MREIKFRGLRPDGIWEYGDLYTVPEKGWTLIRNRVDGERFFVRPESVGQFMGIKDISGAEIYEGDIVKCGTGRICEVVYFLSPVHAGYDLNPVGGFDCKPPSEFSLWSDLTIIGNVYDNPELLERKS